jgi:hypothetical protein
MREVAYFPGEGRFNLVLPFSRAKISSQIACSPRQYLVFSYEFNSEESAPLRP